jgi:hypothetical protein
MEGALRDGLSAVAEFVPKLALFLVILLVGIVIAKVIAKALNAVLERVGFDRAVERGGVERALSNSQMDASDIVAKLIYYTLLLFVLQLAFGVFGANRISALIEDVIRFLPSLVVAILILVVAAAIAAAVKGLLENMLGGLSSVGVGGGLVRPMQQRWESYLTTAERQAPRIKEQAANAPSAREQGQEAADRAQMQSASQSGDTLGSDATSYSAGSTAASWRGEGVPPRLQ